MIYFSNNIVVDFLESNPSPECVCRLLGESEREGQPEDVGERRQTWRTKGR